MDFFYNLGVWNWFIVGAVLLVLETVVPGVHFVWFGLAAIIIGIVAVATGIAWYWQLILFAIISVATVFVVRRFADPDKEKSDEPHLNIRGSQYIGRVLVVAEEIRQGRGKVRVGDTVWHAEGEDVAAGQRVKVVGVNGTALVVERVGFDD
ncbi:MAG: NfeD family protein [Hyphomicrobiaceae bacterium]|nr:NfeD family protein [Hyphomicrobiaceae bacterium]MCC0010470.1 NfeD family protein [Hyphomicrobiaceae bacterium]